MDTQNDWAFDSAIAAGALAPAAPLPPSVDLRAPWWDIGDQESTGSCVGWATAEGVMRYLLVGAGKLSKSEHLSSRFVWMASKETDEFILRPDTFLEESGTSLKAACDVCRKFGVVVDSNLPFHIATTMSLLDEDVFYAVAAQRKASLYVNARRDTAAWKQALVQGKPVLVGLEVDSEWDTAADRGGMLDNFKPATVRGGHAVSVVGYRADGRFILRNSWGTGWGDAGFGYATLEYIQSAFFDESYIMTV